MKYQILCIFMVSVFTFAIVQPYMNLNAAELWNSTSKDGKSGSKSLYNRNGNNNHKSLYNRKRHDNKLIYNSDLSSIRTSKDIKMSKQKISKLSKIMPLSDLKNRLADIDYALKQEYKIKKKTAILVNKVIRNNEKKRAAEAKRYQKDIEKYELREKIEKSERLERKYASIYGKDSKQARRAHKSYNRSYNKSYRDDQTSSGDVSIIKPKKLFNTHY